MINFEKAYFIRLGRKSNWTEECINSGFLRLGYNSGLHNDCLNGLWGKVENYWIEQGKTKGKAKDYTSQIRKFYTIDTKILWITFFDRKLYYCFAESNVIETEQGGVRERKAINGWSCKDTDGNDLTIDRLSTKLTKTQGYQGTICDIKEIEYLRNKINCLKSEKSFKAKTKKEELINSIIPLIKELHWYDFELLIDLIFTYSGWRRIETLGKTEKSIDLDLMLPINKKRAFVQVKSISSYKEYFEYKDDFENMTQYDEFYYFVHSPDKKLEELINTMENKGLFTGRKIAELVFNSGLIDWVIEKTN